MDPFLLIAIIVAFVGTAYASYSDLKTTEVSDWVPITMGVAGLIINGVHSLVAWDYTYIAFSIGVCAAYLAYGVLMYKLGQWGGADAAILAAIGALIPIYPGFSYFGLPVPYQIALVLNVYLLGAIYSLFYAIVLAFRNKKVFGIFTMDLKHNWRKITFYFLTIAAFMVGSTGILSYIVKDFSLFYVSLSRQVWLLPLFLFMLFYWRFAKVIEGHVFRQKISTKKLKIGDMIAEDIKLPTKRISSTLLEGLTKSQVSEIRKHKKYVTIKEGIRFIPAFLLGLAFTLFMNNVF